MPLKTRGPGTVVWEEWSREAPSDPEFRKCDVPLL